MKSGISGATAEFAADETRVFSRTGSRAETMITRREMLQVGAATAALAVGTGGVTRVLAQQRLTEGDLTRFDSLGNVTLLHVTDIHGQLMPVYFREPSVNLGVGAAKGLPPHVTGAEFLTKFGIPAKSAAAYAMTDQ